MNRTFKITSHNSTGKQIQKRIYTSVDDLNKFGVELTTRYLEIYWSVNTYELIKNKWIKINNLI